MGQTKAFYESAMGRPGSALAALDKFIKQEEAPKKALFELRARLMETIGWPVWAAEERNSLLVKFPAAYQPF